MAAQVLAGLMSCCTDCFYQPQCAASPPRPGHVYPYRNFRAYSPSPDISEPFDGRLRMGPDMDFEAMKTGFYVSHRALRLGFVHNHDPLPGNLLCTGHDN